MKSVKRVMLALVLIASVIGLYSIGIRRSADPATSNSTQNSAENSTDSSGTGVEKVRTYPYVRETRPANSFSAEEIRRYGETAELVCNAAGYQEIYVANAESFIPVTDGIRNDPVCRKDKGNTLHIEGTLAQTQDCFFKIKGNTALVPAVSLSAGDLLTIALYKRGEITADEYYPVSVYLGMQYGDNTYEEVEINLTAENGLTTKDFELKKDVTELTFYMTIQGNASYNTDISWLAVKNSAVAKSAIPDDSVIRLISSELGDNGFSIFPARGVICYVPGADNYELAGDEYMEETNYYLTPEQYGAEGDGITDDTEALQKCIDQAIKNGIPVRGFETYRISNMLSIKGDETNIYLHVLKYEGAEMAVDLSGKYNYIRIDYIDALDSDGGAFRLSTTNELDAMFNEIHLGEVNAYANTIEYINELGGGIKGLYYNRLYAQRLYSESSNCIYIRSTNPQCAENSFYGKHVSNEKGYFVYCEEYGNNDTNRFYEFCIEDSSKNGVYGIATLINCRTVECMDTRRPGGDSGYIVTYDGVLPIGRFENTQVDYEAVNVAGAMTYNDCLEAIKKSYEEGSTKALAYLSGFPAESKDYVVGEANRLWDYYAVSDPERGYSAPYGKIIAYNNHKGFVPDTDWYHKITAADYSTIKTDSITPTIFDIAVNTVIHLDDSYCPVGIREFKVIQYEDKKAKIYDHNNRLVFDGTRLEEGTYVVRCYMTDHEFDVKTEKGTLHFDGNLTRGYYYGVNEAWIVEKLNIVSQTNN